MIRTKRKLPEFATNFVRGGVNGRIKRLHQFDQDTGVMIKWHEMPKGFNICYVVTSMSVDVELNIDTGKFERKVYKGVYGFFRNSARGTMGFTPIDRPMAALIIQKARRQFKTEYREQQRRLHVA